MRGNQKVGQERSQETERLSAVNNWQQEDFSYLKIGWEPEVNVEEAKYFKVNPN